MHCLTLAVTIGPVYATTNYNKESKSCQPPGQSMSAVLTIFSQKIKAIDQQEWQANATKLPIWLNGKSSQ